MADDFDDVSKFEAKETSHTLPLGWQLLFWGLILFGIYYALAYTPVFTGWSQERAYTETLKR
jgi:hypothetical protein